MKLINNETQTKKKLYLILAIAGIVLFTVFRLIEGPVYMTVQSDIKYGEILPIVIDYFGMLLETVSIAVCCGIITVGIVRFGGRRFAIGALIFSALIIYEFALYVLLKWINAGSIPVLWIEDIGFVLMMFLTYIIPLAAVWFLVGFAAKAFRMKNEILKSSGKEEKPLPFKALFDMKNPLLRSALYCSVVVVAIVTEFVRMFIEDAFMIIKSGLPTESSTVVEMLVYYFLCVVFAVLCYFVMLLTMHFVGLKTVKDW